MPAINQENVYRGVILDGGLGQSTGGFPQEVLSLQSREVYDPDSDSWLPADSENNEIMAYLVLIDSKDKETLNAKQLKKVTGWTGASFVDLSEMNLIEVPIQFRVEARTYKENTTLQVTWIDTVDAPPFRTVSKLDKNEVVALQQRYAQVLSATKAPVKPVSAPAKTPTKAPAKGKATSKASKPPTKPKSTTKPTKPVVPKAPIVGKCSADEAYVECYNLKRDDVTDNVLNDIWLAEVGKVNTDEAKITPEQWFVIKENVLRQVSKV